VCWDFEPLADWPGLLDGVLRDAKSAFERAQALSNKTANLTVSNSSPGNSPAFDGMKHASMPSIGTNQTLTAGGAKCIALITGTFTEFRPITSIICLRTT